MKERKMFIASHASLSQGFKEAAKLIVGDSADDITTFCLQAGESADDFRDEVVSYKEKNQETEIVILTDLYGASLFNAMSVLANEENIFVFSGVNLAMVIDLLLDSTPLKSEVIKSKIENYREGTMWLEEFIIDTEEDDF